MGMPTSTLRKQKSCASMGSHASAEFRRDAGESLDVIKLWWQQKTWICSELLSLSRGGASGTSYLSTAWKKNVVVCRICKTVSWSTKETIGDEPEGPIPFHRVHHFWDDFCEKCRERFSPYKRVLMKHDIDGGNRQYDEESFTNVVVKGRKPAHKNASRWFRRSSEVTAICSFRSWCTFDDRRKEE